VTIATWNVNSIKARLDRVIAWLGDRNPDVLCLQELKTAREAFPFRELEEAGWNVAGAFQPTYNGVAILSRHPLEDVVAGMDDGEEDPQARLVAATVRGIRVVSVYVPNGQDPGSDKYAYKLRWLDRVRDWLSRELERHPILVVCGDFNIVPRDQDAHDPKAWEGTVLLNPEVRERLGALAALGLRDVVADRHPEGGPFSWWDYRAASFPRNLGLRIDLLLATADLAGRCVEVFTDRDQRKGDRPSDHVPVGARFEV